MEKKKTKIGLFSVLLFLFTLGICSNVWAATWTWDGGWNNGTPQIDMTAFAAGDDIVITGTAPPTWLNLNAIITSIGAVTISSAGTLNSQFLTATSLTTTAAATVSLTSVSGNVTLGGVLTAEKLAEVNGLNIGSAVSGAVTLAALKTVNGDVTNAGTGLLTIGDGATALNVTGNVTSSGTGGITLAGTGQTTIAGNVTINAGALTVTGTAATAIPKINGNLTLANGTTLTASTAGLNVAKEFIIAGTPTVTGQTIPVAMTTDTTWSTLVTALAATTPITSVDKITVSGAGKTFKIDVAGATCYAVDIAAGAILDAISYPLKVNGGTAAVNTNNGAGIYLGELAWMSGNGSPAIQWYLYGSTAIGSSGADLTAAKLGKNISDMSIAIIAPNPNFNGITANKLGNIAFATNTNLTLPSNVTEIGKILSRQLGDYTINASGNLTTGAVTVTGGNLNLISSGKITILAGSPSVIIGGSNLGAILTIPGSFEIMDEVYVMDNGYFNADFTDPDVTKKFNKLVNLGGTTAGGTLSLVGASRASSTTPNVTFVDAVDLGNKWDGAALAAAEFDGKLIIVGTKALFTTTLGNSTALAAPAAELNLNATDVTFTGIATFTDIPTVTTNGNTSLTFTVAPVGFQANNETRNVYNLTFTAAPAVALTGNLTVNGSLVITGGTLTFDANSSLTVNGELNNTGTLIGTATAKLFINGPVIDWGTFTATDFDVTIGGQGALPVLPAATGVFNSLTMNRAGTSLTAGGTITSTGNLNVTSGTLDMANFALTVGATGLANNATTTIAAGGVLNLVAAAQTHTFNGVVNNSGVIKAATNTTVNFVSAGADVYTGLGTVETGINTALTFGDVGTNPGSATNPIELPSSIKEVGTLEYNIAAGNTLSLGGDLHVEAALTNTLGTLIVSGNKLTLMDEAATSVSGAVGIIDITLGSTFEMTGDAAWNDGVLLADETSNVIINDGVWAPAAADQIVKLNNLTINGATAAASYTVFNTQVDFEIFGNLNINATGGTADFIASPVADNNLIVHGDISVNGPGAISTLNLTGSNATLYGLLETNDPVGINSIVTTTDATTLNIVGNAKQFQLPNDVVVLGKITLNRPAGMRLNNPAAGLLTLGAAPVAPATTNIVLDIQKGKLDLNGNNITFADAGNYIQETPGNYVINNGVSFLEVLPATIADARGCIYNIASPLVEQVTSLGIKVDVDAVVTSGAEGAFRRYPKSVNIPEIGRSTRRYYYVTNADPISELILYYDNDELVANEFGQKIYIDKPGSSDAFGNAELLQGNQQVNPLTGMSTGTGFVKVNQLKNVTSGYTVAGNALAAATYIFALASPEGINGVSKIWTNATGNELWFVDNNWRPVGVPTKDDQVQIIASEAENRGTNGEVIVYVTGDNTTAEAFQLFLDGNGVELRASNNSAGQTNSLLVKGNVYVEGSAGLVGISGKSRLNLIVGDGQTGVETIINAPEFVESAVLGESSGIWVNDLTINAASLQPSNGMRVSGNVNLIANSTITAIDGEDFIFYGFGSAGQNQRTLTVPQSASAKFGNIVLSNAANITTAANFELTGEFRFSEPNAASCQWDATDGTVLCVTAGQKVWNNTANAVLNLFNAEIGAGAGTHAPEGNVYFKGTLTKLGASTLAPIGDPSWAVTFRNTTGQTEIVKQAGELIFDRLVIAPNTKCITSSSFNIRRDLYVSNDASLLCEGGTVTYDGTIPMTIVNISDKTLVHNDVIIAGKVTTPSSWKLAGNLTVVSADRGVDMSGNYSLVQTAGTITITNSQTKRFIDSSDGTNKGIVLNKLALIDGASLTAGPENGADANNSSFYIRNYGANTGMESGIEVDEISKFYQYPVGTVYFETDGTVTTTDAKTIVNKGESSNLQFGNIVISAGTNNIIKTSSDFEVVGADNAGGQGAEFLVAGAGARFEAAAGTVGFTTETGIATISSLSPAVSQFANIRGANEAVVTLNSGDEIFVSGDITVDNTSIFDASGVDSKVKLNSKDTPQYLKGTSTEANAFQFAYLQIDKGDGAANYVDNPYSDDKGVVYMQKPVRMVTGASTALVLTNGVLNLGKDTLFVAANYVTRHNGAIDGAEGTYVIETGHETPKLEDVLFTVENEPTLWNLVVNAAHQATNNLTVNNDLTLNAGGDLTLANATTAGILEPKLLTVYGNITSNGGTLISGSTDKTMNRLVLLGTGTVTGGLRNSLFDGNTAFSITVGREETLGGALTMDNNVPGGANLTIATGVNTLSLNGNTLTLSDVAAANPTGVTIVSGNITADIASTVNFLNLTYVPANMFARSECGTLTSTLEDAELDIRCDLTINRALNTGNAVKIVTGDNILTFASGMTTNPAWSATKYVVGNLVQTVTNVTKVTFPMGNTKYNPVAMKFATQLSTQQIMVSTKDVDPTAGRGGNATNSINVVWDIAPIGTPINDSLLIEFTAEKIGLSTQAGQTPLQGKMFAAKWENGSWVDYRNTIATVTESGSSFSLTAPSNKYPVKTVPNLAGSWAVFSANNNTDEAKDDAISTAKNKLVITQINPEPVTTGVSFKITVALQDQYGQPTTSDVALPLNIDFENGGLTLIGSNPVVSSIPAGRSEFELSLQVNPSADPMASPIAQLKVVATGDETDKWIPAISEYFAVLPEAAPVQASNLTFAKITFTSATVKWDTPEITPVVYNDVIIVAKEGGLLETSELPVNGQYYVPNSVFGAGSNIGNAVVLYNGPVIDATSSIDISGLLPNTQYYVYAFVYTGERGNENYKTSAAVRNPNSFSTLSGMNDDITLGKNNTYETSVTVGTNAPVRGMIYPAGDVDNFNFMVTSAAPNVRVLLTELAGNYTLELYDFTGRRIRRSTLLGTSREALVANDLPAGTYVVKIFAEDGSAWNKSGDEYKLLINTFGSEIFSVTPTP